MGTNEISLDEVATTYDSRVDFDFHLIQWNYREIKPMGRELTCSCAELYTIVRSEGNPDERVGTNQRIKHKALSRFRRCLYP